MPPPHSLYGARLPWAGPTRGEGLFQEGLPAQDCPATASLGQQTCQARKGGRQALPKADERVYRARPWMRGLVVCPCSTSLTPSPGAHFSAWGSCTVSAAVDACWAKVIAKQRPGPSGPSVPGRVLSGSRSLITSNTAHLP